MARVPLHAERGRGQALLAFFADRWGVDVGERSKTVWFEVRSAPEERDPEHTRPEEDAHVFDALRDLLRGQEREGTGRRYECRRVRGQRVQLAPARRPTCTSAGGSTAMTASHSRRMPSST